MNIKTKVLSGLLAVLMLFAMIPAAVFADASASVSYPLTVKVYNPDDGTKSDKTFTSADEVLGFGINGGRSNWTYRTYRKVFFGWSTDSKYADPNAVNSINPNERIYRDIEPISAVVQDLSTVDENTTLYPIIMPVTGLIDLITALSNGGGKFSSSIYQTDNNIFEKADLIKDSYGENDQLTTERKVVSYYDNGVDQYGIHSVSEFYYSDPRVPFLVVENPLGVIKSAKDVTDFSGLTPTGYSFEDLHVKFDENTSVSKEQKNWTFSSSTFMVAAVLDKNGNVLNSNIEQPDSGSLISKFSFDNPNEEKEFIIRTIPRNDNSDSAYGNNTYPSNNIVTASGEDIMKPMELATGDWSNAFISKENAKQAAIDENGIVEFVYGGSISGGVSIDKKNLTGEAMLIAFMLPNFQPIGNVNGQNVVVYDFIPATVKFDKNSISIGDTEEQTIGYSIFAVNSSINSDNYATNTLPGPLTAKGDTFSDNYTIGQKYNINDKNFEFKGWNTKKDGSGTFIDADTVISTDMLTKSEEQDVTLYAQWDNTNTAPVITAADQTITEGDTVNLADFATANDAEDGDLTGSIVVNDGGFDANTPGQYTVTYTVTDSDGETATKTITVTVNAAGQQNPGQGTTPPSNPGQGTSTPSGNSSQTTSPKTGDNSNMLLWIALMLVSCGGVVTTVVVKRKRVRSK